jgi:hypothetical protein
MGGSLGRKRERGDGILDALAAATGEVPVLAVNASLSAAAGKAGSLSRSRRSCWMMTVALEPVELR